MNLSSKEPETSTSSLSALARALEGSFKVETTPYGPAPVAYGELTNGCLYAAQRWPDGCLCVEIEFPEAQDFPKLERAVLEDIELQELLSGFHATPLDLNRSEMADGHLRLIWWPDDTPPPESELGPVMERLSQILSPETYTESGLCWTCWQVRAEAQRENLTTSRQCKDCLQFEHDTHSRMEELDREFASYSAPEAPPFPVPDDLDSEVMNARSLKLRQEQKADPTGYRRRLLGMVLLGQLGLVGGAVGVSLLVLVPLLVIAVLFKWLGPSFLIGAKAFLAQGAKLVFLGLALALGFVVSLTRSAIAAFRAPNLQGVEGLRLERDSAPDFFSWLDELSHKVEAPKVDLVFLDTSSNCGASERRDGKRGYLRVLHLGLPILEMFEKEELEAILAHELAHLQHGDSRAAWVYRTVQSWMDMAWRVESVSHGAWLNRFARWYVPEFFLRAQVIMRQAEFEADARAAKVIPPEAFARALAKISVLGSVYGEAVHKGCRVIPEEPPATIDLIDNARRGAELLPAGRVTRALREFYLDEPDWLDTHPLLKERLAHLDVMAPTDLKLELSPKQPATTLFQDYASLRVEVLGRLPRELAIRQQATQRARQVSYRRLEGGTPQGARDWVRRARDLRRLNCDDEALACYREALVLDPDHGVALEEQLALLGELERWEEALALWNDFANRRPLSVAASLRSSSLALKADRREEAAGFLREALAQELSDTDRRYLERQLQRCSG